MPDSGSPVRALIFDFDGLILDTEVAIFEAWRELYANHGLPLTLETWAQCVGSDFGHYDPASDLEKMLSRKLDWESIAVWRRERVNELLHEKKPMPGVLKLLHAARKHEIPCAVASSSPHEWVDGWLARLELTGFFKNITCLEDTGKVKPDPSLFLHAAGKLGVPPAEIIVLEDSLNGLRAAHAAGMRCIVVPCDITRHLNFHGAWRQLKSLEEMSVPELLGLEPRLV